MYQMNLHILFTLLFLAFTQISLSQNSGTMKIPYQQIPEYPSDFSSGNVLSRFIDGLGYRYYWATQGLTEKDLKYAPSKDARNMLQTLQHIHGLSKGIANAPQNAANVSGQGASEMSFEKLRKQTLDNLAKASQLVAGKSAEEVAGFKVIFQSGEKKREFPYWHMINGQISDAIYHVGQVVTLRRSSGNPINPKVNVFMGKTGK